MSTEKKTFNDLKKVDVSRFVEKKGGLDYISWANAVDLLMQQDPSATWEFKEPTMYGNTMMVHCAVTALGKTLIMHLPVMDNRNNAVENPNARKVSDAMMRCLTKCIACFGIGLSLYSGEDIPSDQNENSDNKKPEPTKTNKPTNGATGPRTSFGARPQPRN